MADDSVNGLASELSEIDESMGGEASRGVSVGSFWGAVASLSLLQAFGYVTFNAFQFYLQAAGRETLFVLWGGMWVLLFMLFQSDVIGVIRERLSGGSRKQLVPSNAEDAFKLLLSLAFLGLLFAFNLGYYPLLSVPYGNLQLLIFYAVSWALSVVLSKSKTHFIIRTRNRLAGIVICGIVVVLVRNDLALLYTAGLVCIGWGTIILTSWLLEGRD